MELRQLEYFVAVAEEANFTRAAARVNISQSGISAQLRSLERELGTELIDRSSRIARPTVAGKAALEHARVALAAAAALQRSVDEVSSLVRGKVVVGMVTACTVTPLFDALADFHSAYPGVEVTLAEGNSDDLVDGVRDGTMDVALVGTPSAPPEGLAAMTIVEEGLAVCVPAEHPLTELAEVAMRDVCGYPVLCLPTGTGIRAVFDDSCSAKGLVRTIAVAASAPAAVADLAARGMGVGILSASMASDFTDRVVALPIVDVEIDAVLALVWAERPSVAAQELVSRVRRSFFG